MSGMHSSNLFIVCAHFVLEFLTIVVSDRESQEKHQTAQRHGVHISECYVINVKKKNTGDSILAHSSVETRWTAMMTTTHTSSHEEPESGIRDQTTAFRFLSSEKYVHWPSWPMIELCVALPTSIENTQTFSFVDRDDDKPASPLSAFILPAARSHCHCYSLDAKNCESLAMLFAFHRIFLIDAPFVVHTNPAQRGSTRLWPIFVNVATRAKLEWTPALHHTVM